MAESNNADWRQVIERLKAELQEEVNNEEVDSVELDQSRVGRLSRIDALQSQQMALEQHRRRERKLLALTGALRRIESGDFGYCFVCGEEIEKRRLTADPTVTRCISCVDAEPD